MFCDWRQQFLIVSHRCSWKIMPTATKRYGPSSNIIKCHQCEPPPHDIIFAIKKQVYTIHASLQSDSPLGRRKIPGRSRVLHHSLALTRWLFAGFRDPVSFTFAGRKWKNVGACFRYLFSGSEDVVSAAVVAHLSHVRWSFCMRVIKTRNFKGPWDQGVCM